MLIIGDEEVPETELIDSAPLSNSKFSWKMGDRGTKPRAPFIDVITGHWTGGEATLRMDDSDGDVVVSRIKNRKGKLGTPLVAAVHFIIGACNPEDEIAPIYQTMDPAFGSAVHVGYRPVYRRSIGVEVVNCGLPGKRGKNNTRNRPVREAVVNSKVWSVCEFFPGQLRAWQELCEILTMTDGPISTYLNKHNIMIPRNVFPHSGKMTLLEANKFRGVIEHMNVPFTPKIDAAGLLLDALEWE